MVTKRCSVTMECPVTKRQAESDFESKSDPIHDASKGIQPEGSC